MCPLKSDEKVLRVLDKWGFSVEGEPVPVRLKLKQWNDRSAFGIQQVKGDNISTVEPLYFRHPWDSLKCPD